MFCYLLTLNLFQTCMNFFVRVSDDNFHFWVTYPFMTSLSVRAVLTESNFH